MVPRESACLVCCMQVSHITHGVRSGRHQMDPHIAELTQMIKFSIQVHCGRIYIMVRAVF